jgi:LmbE family N-acetylglucosaminyl deacetylase
MAREIAVIAAHPDDEILGCGATMARHAAAGDRIRILIAAEGATSRQSAKAAEECEALREAGRKAARIVGAASIEWLGLPDNRMDSIDLLDLVHRVEQFLAQRPPDIVYTHHAGDLNIDHVLTQRAVMTALRPLPGARFRTVLQFEVPSSTEWGASAGGSPFVPQWFEEVSGFMDAKLAALDAYASEMRPAPHPRSREAVTALARMRGATAGVPAAEAYMLAWQVNRATK